MASLAHTTPPDRSPQRSLGLLDLLEGFVRQLDERVDGLDPMTLHAADAAELIQAIAAVERRLGGLRLACAARALQSAAASRQHSRSGEHWYARQTGIGLDAARRQIETSRRLQELERTRQQALAGALSEVQIDRVADAAAANPRSEGTLLQAAATEGLRGLATACQRAKAEVRDEQQELQRVAAAHRRRFLRHGRTADGAFRIEVHTTPDAGARVVAAVDRRAALLFEEARRQGRREPHHAYQADALVELVTQAPSRPGAGLPVPGPDSPATATRRDHLGPAATITFLVDAEAFRRGQLAEGERCELAGVGPVPLAMVERYVGQSRLNLVVSRGVDIAAVVSLGRAVPSALRTALEVRDPVCVVPGCDVSAPLEIDHWQVPFAEGGKTELANLARICPRHHDLKTYRGYTLRGGPGRWSFEPPDDVSPAHGRSEGHARAGPAPP